MILWYLNIIPIPEEMYLQRVFIHAELIPSAAPLTLRVKTNIKVKILTQPPTLYARVWFLTNVKFTPQKREKVLSRCEVG